MNIHKQKRNTLQHTQTTQNKDQAKHKQHKITKQTKKGGQIKYNQEEGRTHKL